MLNLSLQYSFDEYKIWRVSVTRLFTSVSPPEYTGARSCTLYTVHCTLYSLEEETERIEGRDRRCCLGAEFFQLHVAHTDLVPGWLWEKDE